MLDVVIRKRGHGVVAVVIVRLIADIQSFHASFLRRTGEVFGEKLPLLVEVVARSLLSFVVSLTLNTLLVTAFHSRLSLYLLGDVQRQSRHPGALSISSQAQ